MTVGLQRMLYEIVEDEGYVLVCTAVESGSVDGRTITIDYQTTNNGAIGLFLHVANSTYRACFL